jgi:hypothetical protein
MAASQDRLMELMSKGKGGGNAGPTPTPPPVPPMEGMSDTATPPTASPMSTPEPKMGSQEGAMINLSMAMDLIEQALPALGSESEQGQKALAAIRSLTGVIGPRKGKTNELQQSEILQMLQSLPKGVGPDAMGSPPMAGPAGGGMPPPPVPSAPPPPMGGGAVPQPM